MVELLKLKTELQNIAICSPSNAIASQLEQIETDLNQISMQKVQSAIFRSCSMYYKDSDKNTKFFFSLEKRRYMEKNMKCVINEQGTHIMNQQSILNEQTKFYRALYSRDEDVHFMLQLSPDEKRLSAEQKMMCDMELQMDEIFDAIMTLKSGKVGGIDGLSLEFYCTFYKDLKNPYHCFLSQKKTPDT